MNTQQATDRDIARTVTGLLDEARISTKAASERTGIARATLIRRLNGSPFTMSELRAIAELLNTSMTSIIHRAGQDAA